MVRTTHRHRQRGVEWQCQIGDCELPYEITANHDDPMEVLSAAIAEAEDLSRRLSQLQRLCGGWNASLLHQLIGDIYTVNNTLKGLRSAKSTIEKSIERKKK